MLKLEAQVATRLETMERNFEALRSETSAHQQEMSVKLDKLIAMGEASPLPLPKSTSMLHFAPRSH